MGSYLILLVLCGLATLPYLNASISSECRWNTPQGGCAYGEHADQDDDVYFVEINASDHVACLPKFWRSTGLCPPDPHEESYKFFSSTDFILNLMHIQSLPYEGITHVRIHWLLTLVDVTMNSNGTSAFVFTKLDSLVKAFWDAELYFIFELMGNPSGYFSDFEDQNQVFLWRDMVRSLANHYIDTYGISFVSKWRFESWNEPDHHDFDTLHFTVQGFLNYYDACSEGLRSASPRLKLGGPGGSCHMSPKSPMCWALLEHCVSGKNFFTGEIGTRIDFISIHKKGDGNSQKILSGEIETISHIKEKYPTLSDLPIYNDEGDPMKGWSKCMWWRADATYAAFVVKVIEQHMHYYFMKNGSLNNTNTNFDLLSNDNAFLSYYPCQFTQRTLLARLQINNTSPPYVDYIRKPIFFTMGLLSRMCCTVVDVKFVRIAAPKASGGDSFGVIPTSCTCGTQDRQRLTILFYYSEDIKATSGSVLVKVNIEHALNGSDIKWVLYQINNIEGNPYSSWMSMGCPAFPNGLQMQMLKDSEEPYLERVGDVGSQRILHVDIRLFKPGLSYLEMCKRGPPPVMTSQVYVFKISSNTVQIVWKDKNRCVLTYHIEHSLSYTGPYVLLNEKFVTFPSYWHSCASKGGNCTTCGYYRVRAVDFWHVPGPYSPPYEFMN